LGQKFGRVHRYDVRNAAEAVAALKANFKEFARAVVNGGSYRVLVGGRRALGVKNMREPMGAAETLRIVPVIQGAKNSNVLSVIVGAILVVVDYVFFDGCSGLSRLGYAMIIGGAASMLFAPPAHRSSDNERPENQPSYAFDGAVNTAAQGNPVPICYGRLIVGAQVISAGFTVTQFV